MRKGSELEFHQLSPHFLSSRDRGSLLPNQAGEERERSLETAEGHSEPLGVMASPPRSWELMTSATRL